MKTVTPWSVMLIAMLLITADMSSRCLATERDEKGAEKRSPSSDKKFVMHVVRPGFVFFQGKEYELKDIKAAYLRYRKDLGKTARPTAVLRASEGIEASTVQQLIKILQDAGVEKFALPARSAPKRQSTDKQPSTSPNPTATRSLTLEITRQGKIVIGGQTVSPDDLKAQLLKQRDRVRTGGRKAQDVTVHLLSDEDATAGLAQTVIKQCQAVGFEKFKLRSRPDPAAKEKPLPRSVRLRLFADAKGDLAEIVFNGRTYDSFSDLNRYLRNLHQKQADSIPEEVEIEADYVLKYRHVIRAVSSVTGYKTQDGGGVGMTTKIKFVPSKKSATKESSP